MKVLMSAYACEPGKGSEPGVGFTCMLAAAAEHDVWVVTRANNIASIRLALDSHPLRDRIHLVGFDLGRPMLAVKRVLGPIGMHIYYDRWQKAVGRLCANLDREEDFDVVHHATFATNWTRFGVSIVDKPIVIGPVGGSVRTPLRLWPALGIRGIPGEIARTLARPLLAWATGARKSLRRADLALAQNPKSLGPLQNTGRGSVLANGLVGALADLPVDVKGPSGGVVFVARLVGWKGASLAIGAMRHVADDKLVLDVYGAGPDHPRLRRLAVKHGLGERVRFHGKVPRSVVLGAMSNAGALIHPALHEESSVTVGEALSLGTPVVCLDIGGPPIVLSHWPLVPSVAVHPSSPAKTARALASALDLVVGRRVAPNPTPGHLFSDTILASYRAVARQAEK